MMSQIGQIYYNVAGEYSNHSSVPDGKDNIYVDIVSQVGASQFTKVGIQAPPGTQVSMNKIKEIMIGRTGIYELDEDIAITELYFYRPVKYTVNAEKTKANQEEGLAMMNAAIAERNAAIEGLNPEDAEYQAIEAKYLVALQAGYSKYISKVFDSEQGELHDVIIDYIQE